MIYRKSHTEIVRKEQKHRTGWSHISVRWLKIRWGILAVKAPPEEPVVPTLHQNPQPRVLVSAREIPITSGCENQWGLCLNEMEGTGVSGILLTGYILTYWNSLVLSSSTGAAAQKASGIYREGVNCLASEWGLEGQPDRSAGRGHCSFAEPFPYRTN